MELQIAIHCSNPVPFFKPCRTDRLRLQIVIGLRLIRVIIRKSRVNLRQRKMPKLPSDLFRNQAHIVPLGDSADRDACPRNTRPAAPYFGILRDETANLCNRRRSTQV
jgi:hypothetical protein